jgi:ankyrin repeat protein
MDPSLVLTDVLIKNIKDNNNVMLINILKCLDNKNVNIIRLLGSLMIFAANEGNTEIVKLLLDRGANIHADDNAAIQYAVDGGHLKTAELLIDYGAIPSQSTLEQLLQNYEIMTSLAKKGHIVGTDAELYKLGISPDEHTRKQYENTQGLDIECLPPFGQSGDYYDGSPEYTKGGIKYREREKSFKSRQLNQ